MGDGWRGKQEVTAKGYRFLLGVMKVSENCGDGSTTP